MKLRLLESFVAVVLISITAAVWSSKRLLSPNLSSKISQRTKCCFSVVKTHHYAGRNIKRLNSMNGWSCSEVPNDYQSVLDRMLLSLTSILLNKQSKTESKLLIFIAIPSLSYDFDHTQQSEIFYQLICSLLAWIPVLSRKQFYLKSFFFPLLYHWCRS